MAIANYIKDTMSSPESSAIRKMFEEGVALKKQVGADNVFDFSLGNPDLEPPNIIEETIKEVAALKESHKHAYMPNAGYDFARSAMAQKTSREQGMEVSADFVIMQAGAAAALNAVLKALLNNGDEVIVPVPYFSEYKHYCANHNGRLVPLMPKEDFCLDLETLPSLINEKTAAFLINSPNNPTGKVYTKEELVALCDILKEQGKKIGRDIYLICDEPYRDIVYDEVKVPSVFDIYNNTIIVTSFAKNLSLPGERIGYIAVNPKASEGKQLVAACTFCARVLGFVNANAFFQRVVAKSWDAIVDFSSYKIRRNAMLKVLDTAGIICYKPQGAFYLFCKVPTGYNEDASVFCDYLKTFYILCAPGGGFGMKDYFRISYCVNLNTIERSQKAFCKAMNKEQ